MIAVVTSGNYVDGALNYNLDKVKAGEANIIGSAHCLASMGGRGEQITVGQVKASFARHLQNNRRTKNVVFSCSLNPHPDDAKKLDNDTFMAMAKDYMDGMGYGKQPYIVVRHDDIDRPHIHIVSLRIDADGKKINDSMEHKRSNRVRQEIEHKYGLKSAMESSISETREGKSECFSKFKEKHGLENLISSDVTNDKLKKRMKGILLYLQDHYKLQNFMEFNKVLRQFSMTCREIEGFDTKGNLIKGCQYVVLGADGEPTSLAFKGSAFGKAHTLEGLKARFKRCPAFDRERTEIKEDVRRVVDYEVANAEVRSLENLSEKLQKKGIKIVSHSSSDGRIMGVTFIDNATGFTFKGSELGKEYGISYLQNRLSNADKNNGVGQNSNQRFDRMPSRLRHGEEDLKHKIDACLEEVRGKFRPQTMDELNDLLKNYNVQCFLVEGVTKSGKNFKGCKYTLVDECGKQVGHAFSGSLFGKEHSLVGLQRRFRANGRLSKTEWRQANQMLTHRYNADRKEGYFFESDFIRSLSSKRDVYTSLLVDEFPQVRRNVLEATVNAFIQYRQERLSEIEKKERGYVYKQMQYALRFASLVSEDKRADYLRMMDIRVDRVGERLLFSHAKHPDYQFSWMELASPMQGERVSLSPFTPFSITESKSEGPDSTPLRLSKQEREITKAFVTGEWTKIDLTDRRKSFHALQSLLSAEGRIELQKRQTFAQSNALMKQYSHLGTEKMVGELLTRGIVVIPSMDKTGRRTYWVGNAQFPKETFCELPQVYADDLTRMHYSSSVYPDIKRLVYSSNGEWVTRKYRVASVLATARDYDDAKMVDRVIDQVKRYNLELSLALGSHVSPSKIDYDAMIDTVLRYTGEALPVYNKPKSPTGSLLEAFIEAVKTGDAKEVERVVSKKRGKDIKM